MTFAEAIDYVKRGYAVFREDWIESCRRRGFSICNEHCYLTWDDGFRLRLCLGQPDMETHVDYLPLRSDITAVDWSVFNPCGGCSACNTRGVVMDSERVTPRRACKRLNGLFRASKRRTRRSR